MGVVEFSETFSSPLPAPKLFKGWFVDSHAILPKIAPERVKSIVVEGGGGPGSIYHITFGDVVPIKFVKFRVDVLDESTMTYADTVVEGGELSEKILSVTHEMKFETSPEGGCSAKSVVKFDIKEGSTLSEDEVKHGKEGGFALLKAIEAYLLAN